MKRLYRIFLWILALATSAFILPILCNMVCGYFVARGLQQTMPLGWWHVIQRNLASITINWNLIGMAVLCSALMIGVGHYLMKSVHGFAQNAETPEQSPRAWRWQWTLGLYLGLWILFAIACGTAGLREQISWLAKDDRPWLEERLNAWYTLKQLDLQIRTFLYDDDDLYATHKAYVAGLEQYRWRQLLLDTADVIFYGTENGKVAAHVIIPRQPQLAKKGLFGVGIEDPPQFTIKEKAELVSVITELEAKYPRKR